MKVMLFASVVFLRFGGSGGPSPCFASFLHPTAGFDFDLDLPGTPSLAFQYAEKKWQPI